jgi:hypothetical protein
VLARTVDIPLKPRQVEVLIAALVGGPHLDLLVGSCSPALALMAFGLEPWAGLYQLHTQYSIPARHEYGTSTKSIKVTYRVTLISYLRLSRWDTRVVARDKGVQVFAVVNRGHDLAKTTNVLALLIPLTFDGTNDQTIV